MKTLKTCCLFLLLLISSTGTFAGERPLPGPTHQPNDLTILRDRAGNRYLVGTFHHTCKIAGLSFFSSDSTAAFLIKTDRKGRVKWYRTFEAHYLTISEVWIKDDHILMIGEFHHILYHGITGISDSDGSADYILALDLNGHTDMLRSFSRQRPVE